jgi:hypothetical protein
VSSPPRIETGSWERVDEWTERAFDVPAVTVEAHNAVYERPDFRAAVAGLMPAGIDQSMRALFTTGLSFDPRLPGSETPDRLLGVAARYAGREFQRSLTEDGLADVERTGSTDLRVRGRRTAKAFQYDAGYPLDVGAAGGAGQPHLAVRVWAAIWPTETSFGMAGGIYPLEDLATALAGSDPDREPDVEIETLPGGDRREVLERIREAAE